MIERMIQGKKGDLMQDDQNIILKKIVIEKIKIEVIERKKSQEMMEVMGEDYVSNEREKGIKIRRIVGINEMRNEMIKVIKKIGMKVGVLMEGEIMKEKIL